MKTLLKELAALTARAEPFVLATILARSGSAPRSAGARMLIRADGSTLGTIGGGILEARVTRLALPLFATHASFIESFEFSGADAAVMDAICGGEVDVLLEWIDPADPNWQAVLAAMLSALARRNKAWLLTALPPAQPNPTFAAVHLLVQPDGAAPETGSLPLPLERIEALRKPLRLSAGGQAWLVEPLETGGTVFIFGAGHVGRGLAFFTQAVGFHTVVLDDRPEYANAEDIPAADEVIVLPAFESAFDILTVDEDSFIVIVTRGHLNDRAVLAQALKSKAAYIGMIGSRRKCALVYTELRKEGFSDADFHRVHAPIGLAIQAETPAEIGVSIVAELIQARAALSGDRP